MNRLIVTNDKEISVGIQLPSDVFSFERTRITLFVEASAGDTNCANVLLTPSEAEQLADLLRAYAVIATPQKNQP